MSNIFSQVEKEASSTNSPKPSWVGQIVLNIPSLKYNNVAFNLRGAKAHGDQEALKIIKMAFLCPTCLISLPFPRGPTVICSKCGRQYQKHELLLKEVKGLERVIIYRYREAENGERLDWQEVPYAQGKEKIRFNNDDGQNWLISGKNEKRLFLKEDLDGGVWTEVPYENTGDFQEIGGQLEEVSPFDRTDLMEISEKDVVPLDRTLEYLFKSVYVLSANTSKEVKESPNRVLNFARTLLENQVAVVSFFAWGRKTITGGYTFYTAVIFPYERKQDGKLWLLMGMSEGILTLPESWSLEAKFPTTFEPLAPVPTAKKPKVNISK